MTQFSIGDLHLILLHFPIVWITTAFIFDFIYLFKRESIFPKIADWMIIASAFIIIPTVLTGLILAGWNFDDPIILEHRNWALITLVVTILHAFFRIYYSQIKDIQNPKYILLSLINVGLVGITSDWGGLLAFGFSIIV